MPRVKPTTLVGAKQFFTESLREILQRQKVVAQENSVHYLVELILHYMEAKNFFAKNAEGKPEDVVLTNLYAEYLQSSDDKKLAILKRLGDLCMLTTGFFSDSLQRKVVDVDYYFGMGGNAYAELSRLYLTKTSKALYKELAEKFRSFSDVLGEMSERSGLNSNRDVLRLYEKWLLTGSERLKKLLDEKGIGVPVRLDAKVKH